MKFPPGVGPALVVPAVLVLTALAPACGAGKDDTTAPPTSTPPSTSTTPSGYDASDTGSLDQITTLVEQLQTIIPTVFTAGFRDDLQDSIPWLDVDTVFSQALGNSLKFHGEDPPRLRVDAALDPEDPERWLIRFRDNGIGIDAEYAERIFVIFQRLHPRDQYEGTGIGLALAKKIVEFHGGTIWLDTTRPRGTAIRFTLPESRKPLARSTA